MESWLLRNFEI